MKFLFPLLVLTSLVMSCFSQVSDPNAGQQPPFQSLFPFLFYRQMDMNPLYSLMLMNQMGGASGGGGMSSLFPMMMLGSAFS
ncbi:hypothetical protein Bpfe_006976 [Biomphalaria pfeifferi]|uniref:Uncharacterized protein n=1 Tax=Biomphalaria pfeifferi TaxID=112525 RepID=A0AAD8FGB1_BIOPF|nr:hypothetical protein Bpfe_006976 [Biomphalaria pfeifferi]